MRNNNILPLERHIKFNIGTSCGLLKLNNEYVTLFNARNGIIRNQERHLGRGSYSIRSPLGLKLRFSHLF